MIKQNVDCLDCLSPSRGATPIPFASKADLEMQCHKVKRQPTKDEVTANHATSQENPKSCLLS
jgi:hypothetical protein